MDLDYFTDDSERSLAPFFLPRILFASYGTVFLVGVLSLLVWPRHASLYFLSVNSVPNHFFLTASVSLIVFAYVNLHCGRGDLVRRSYLGRLEKEERPLEKERSFLTYGMIEFFLHSLFLLFPFLPLWILSASISGISLADMTGAVFIIFTTSLLCRMFGFTTYLVWGWWNVAGYLTGISLSIYFIFVSALFTPGINPVLLLYRLNTSVEDTAFFSTKIYSEYMAVILSAILFFTLVNFLLVHRHRRKEQEP